VPAGSKFAYRIVVYLPCASSVDLRAPISSVDSRSRWQMTLSFTPVNHAKRHLNLAKRARPDTQAAQCAHVLPAAARIAGCKYDIEISTASSVLMVRLPWSGHVLMYMWKASFGSSGRVTLTAGSR